MAIDFESLGFTEVGGGIESTGFKPVDRPASYFPKNRFADLGFQETEDNLTTVEKLKSAGTSVLRGAGAMLTSIPKGIAVGKKGIEEAIPATKYIPSLAMLVPPDTVINKTREVEDWASQLAPQEAEQLSKSWLWQKFPRGVGSALGFLAGGTAAAGAKIPAWLSAASLGTLSTYSDTYEDAKRHGADEQTALAAAFTSTPLGASEAVPMANWINRINRGTGGSFLKMLMHSTKETLEEGLQESFQNIGGDLIAKGFYDPNRELFGELRDAASTGGAVGLFMSLLTQTVGNSMSRRKGIRSRYRAPEVPRSEPIIQQPDEPQERPAVQVPVQPVSTVAASQAVEATPVVREEAPIGGEIIERPKEERRAELLTPPGAASVAPVSREILVYRGGELPDTGLPWFTEDAVEAAKYGPVKAYWLKVSNPASVEGGFLPERLIAGGFDAARFDNPMSKEGRYGGQKPQWVPLNRNQIRLAEQQPEAQPAANAPETPISRPTVGTADRPVQAPSEVRAVPVEEGKKEVADEPFGKLPTAEATTTLSGNVAPRQKPEAKPRQLSAREMFARGMEVPLEKAYGTKVPDTYVRQGDVYVPAYKKGERVITSDYGPGVVESVLPNRIRVLPDSGGKAIGVNPKRVRKAPNVESKPANVESSTQQMPSTAQAKTQEEVPPARSGDVAEKQQQSTAPQAGGKQTVATPPRVARGSRAKKVFDSETRLQGQDILAWIDENMPMMSKAAARAKYGSEWWSRNGGVYDDATPLQRPHHNIIYRGNSMPDQVAQAAFEAGILKSPDVPELWRAIRESSNRRAKAFTEAKHQEAALKNEIEAHEDWLKATAEGEIRVTADDLHVGDAFEVEGERFKVTDVNPDTGDVTLEDGRKFGVQRLSSGQSIYVESFQEMPAPKSGELFLPEETPFNLTAEEQKFVEPTKTTTGYGTETFTQNDLFAIQEIVKDVDPFKSAKAAEKLYGGPKEAVKVLERQLRTLDENKEFKKQFGKDQRARLSEVLNVLRQKASEQSGVASGEQQGSVAKSNEGTQASGETMGEESRELNASPENPEGYQQFARGEMPVEAMAEDLRESGKVLRGSKSEIARALPIARRETERDSVRGKRTLRAVSKRTLRDLYPRAEAESRQLPTDTRVFIEGTPETQLPVAQRNIDILAHGILFGANRKSGTGSTLSGIDFIRRLSDRLTGLRIVFEGRPDGKSRADYMPRQTGEAYDILRVNLTELSKSDLTQSADLDLWVSTLVEEILHAATFRVSSNSELAAVWNSLSKDEQENVLGIYDADIKTDHARGAEYLRMVLQERLFGHSTELKKTTITEKIRGELRKLLNLLIEAFGKKPESDIARKIMERIEGAIKGEAPIEQSIFEEGRESIGASPDKPIADTLQRGDIEDAGDEYIPTEVFGIRDKVLDKTQYTDEKRETALGVAKSVFDEAGLTTARDGDGHFQLTNTGKKDNAAGQKLVDATRKQIAKYGQGALELTELVQSLVLDFKNGRMDALFDKPIRNALYSLAQGERSFRGVSLNALRGAGEDIKFIAQNIDVYLQRVWHEAFGGTEIDRVITKIRDNLKAFFTPEVIKEIVEANPALAKVEGAEKIVADGLATDFANLNMLRDTYADALTKAGVPEKEAMVLAKQIIEALKPRIRLAAADVAKKVEESLTADEKTAVKGKKPIWQRIVDAVARGELDSAPALRDKARENGWKPPSDEDIARIKRLAERERNLHELTQKEKEAAAGNPDKMRRDQVVREQTTLPQRLPLMRQMEAEWAAITRPVNYGRGLWRNRANNAAFLNELVSANLLLRLSFAPKQALSVLSQFLVHVPTRAVAQAIELHSQSKSLEQDTALRKDIYNSLTGAYTSALAGFKDGMAQFIAAGKGRGEARNVDRLMSGISAIERIDAQAKAYAEQGKTGMAILFRMLSFIRLGYRIAQAFDNLHGVPSEYVELRHQAVRELMKNGVERAAANAQADNIIESIKKNHINATVQAKAFLDAQGQKYTSEQLREISYRIARRWAYEDMRALGLPADEFMAENRGLRETIGWNEREAGTASIGGLVGEVVSKTGKVGEKIGLPLALGRFGNAIAISINRALHFTPMGFFPGAFGDNNAWFRSELDRNQRKVEASVGTMLGSIAFMLALSGVLVVRLRWPKDKEERDLFEAQGHRPGTIEIPNGDGSFSAISMNTGLAAFLAPYLAAGGALRDLLTEREGQQAKLNAEAARKGLPAEQIRPMSFADMVGVAAQSAYQTVLGGRTAAGAVASIADYGIPNVTKIAASQTAPLIPGLPALQEMSRMGGVVLDSKLATFTDFLLPLPTSKARRVNFLGEPAGTPDDLQRIVQVLTGGSYPNVDPKQAEAQRAYSILFNTDFKPGSINPNKGYAIGNSFRPFNDAELENYTALRGQEFKQALGQLPENADIKTVRAAFRSANQRALGKMGVNAFVRKTKTRRSRGLRSRGIRSLRSRRKGIRSLRSPSRFSYV